MPRPVIADPGKTSPLVTRLPGADCIRSPGKLDFHVGNRIKGRRLEVRMTQTELANHLGVTFQQIQKYEGAANRVGAARLYEIATVLGTDIAYFFENWQQVAGLPVPAHDPVPGDLAEERAGYSHETAFADAEGREAAVAFITIKNGDLRKRLLSLMKSMRYC